MIFSAYINYLLLKTIYNGRFINTVWNSPYSNIESISSQETFGLGLLIVIEKYLQLDENT